MEGNGVTLGADARRARAMAESLAWVDQQALKTVLQQARRGQEDCLRFLAQQLTPKQARRFPRNGRNGAKNGHSPLRDE